MDFREACNFFGGTIFYDDLRSSLCTIRDKLQHRKAALRFPLVDDVASYLLLQALLDIWSGDLSSAERLLSCLRCAEVYGERWVSRAWAYTGLLRTCRNLPPLFKGCVFGGATYTVWKTATPQASPTDALKYCENYNDTSPIDLLELNVIRACASTPSAILWTRRLNPAFDGYIVVEEERALNQELVQKVKDYLKDTMIQLTQWDLPLVTAYLARLFFEISRAVGNSSTNAAKDLEAMREVYYNCKDGVGMGFYWLLRGDYHASPSFTSPLLLNFDISDSLERYGGDSCMFHGETSYPFPDVEENEDIGADDAPTFKARFSQSKKCYEKAAVFFGKAQSERGIALLALRKACLGHMECLQPATIRHPILSHSSSTFILLEESVTLARKVGDVQLERLIQAHQLISKSLTLEVRQKAGVLAHWAINNENETFRLTIALLAFRRSHYLRYFCGSYLLAYESLEICRQVVKPQTGVFATLWYQTMIAQISLWTSVGHLEPAKIWAKHLKESTWLLEAQFVKVELSKAWIITHVLQSTVEAVITLGPLTADVLTFPDEETNELLRFLSKFPSPVSEWRHYQSIRTTYERAIKLSTIHSQRGQLEKSREGLKNFLEDFLVTTREDLQTRALQIKIALQYGAKATAQSILNSIEDEDCIPDYHFQFDPVMEARNQQKRRQESLEVIFLLCIELQQWKRAKRLMEALETTSPGFFTSVISYTNLWPWQRCLYAGLVYENLGQYADANRYFLQARLFLLSWETRMRSEDRRSFLAHPDVARIATSAARCALMWKVNQPNVAVMEPSKDPAIDKSVFQCFGWTLTYKDHNDHYMESLQLLESVRASAIVVRNEPEEIREARHKLDIWKRLMVKVRRSKDEEQEFQTLETEKMRYEAIAYSYVPEAVAFSAPIPRDVPQLYMHIPKDSLVIYTTLDADGLMLTVFDYEGIRFGAVCPTETSSKIEKYALVYMNEIINNGDFNASESTGRIACNLLSDIIIKPLENCISKRRHIIFVPSGVLTRIPLSSLLYNGDFLILQRQVSQVPSLSLLSELLQRQPKPAANSKTPICAIARPGNPRNRWLPLAGLESQIIASLAGTIAINAKELSRTELPTHLRQSEILHICTHGHYDTDDPFNSHLVLKDRFRVQDLRAVRTEIALVTFSACLSGLGPASDSGDVQGFSHVMLEAGANAFIGALWKVNDAATMLHMWFFYIELLVRRQTPTIAEAWQSATESLYNMKSEDTVEMLELSLEVWSKLEGLGKDPVGFGGGNSKSNGKTKIQAIIDGYRRKDPKWMIAFKHPKIWAPFILVGNASLHVWSSKHEEIRGRLA